MAKQCELTPSQIRDCLTIEHNLTRAKTLLDESWEHIMEAYANIRDLELKMDGTIKMLREPTVDPRDDKMMS
jgi:hypothetical protein